MADWVNFMLMNYRDARTRRKKSIEGNRRYGFEEDITEVKTDNDIFITWGVIARALGVTARAARHYEVKLKLPVKRQGGFVYITGGDLKKWRARPAVRRYNERRVENITGIDAGDLVIGWADIAQLLGVSVRTARRYRGKLGLPVENQAGRVITSQAALKEWRVAENQRHYEIRNERGLKRKEFNTLGGQS